MRNLMYAAVAFCAISVGVVAIGVGKAANAYGDSVNVNGHLSLSLNTRLGESVTVHCLGCN